MDLFQLLTLAVAQNASDLHLSSNHYPLLRVAGKIEPLSTERLSADDLRVMLGAVMDDADKVLLEQNRQHDFLLNLPQLGRFRVNVFQQLHGLSAALRLIPERILTLEQLGAPAVVANFAMRRQGLLLVTGATGSGKSTTLAAIVDHINRQRHCHIVTIEDPVEFVHCNNRALINQRQLGQHTLSFADALRAALRQDPDIILIGEIRDAETMRLALTAAETGHLVLSTLHTASATTTVNRIVDMVTIDKQEMVRGMLAESLVGIVAQVLLPQISSGRVAAWEILSHSAAVANLIRENKTAQLYSVMQTSKISGMQTMEQCIHLLAQQNQITTEVASRGTKISN